jgi:outer membrane protein assembly factor BamB
MIKNWKILISVLSTGLLCLYIIGQTILTRDPVSHNFLLRQVWKTSLKGKIVGISVASDELILARTDSSLNALDAKSGEIIWQQTLAWQAEPRPAVAQNGKVYVTDGDLLLALDQNNGSILWQQATAETESWVTDVSDNVVIINQIGVDIMVFDVNTGAFLWREPVCRGFVQAFAVGEKVYVPCDGLEAFDVISGKPSWKADIGVVGDIGYSISAVYYYTNSVEAYDLQNQKIFWNTPLSKNGLENFKVFKDTLFYTDASRACMININSGQLKWCTKILYPQTPAVLEDNIYIFDGTHKTLTAHQTSNGKKTGELRLSNFNYFIMDRQLLISTKNLLFFTNGKYVYAFGD